MHISKGNMKMKNGFLIWNLPAVTTCIGSTPICREKCYALKAEKFRSCPTRSVRACRERNYEFTQKDDFSYLMSEAIADMAYVKRSTTWQFKKSFKGYFRIHESGDFYSQKYLDDWYEICEAHPDIRFLAFTKSFTLDFSGKPDNLELVMSIMPDTVLLPKHVFELSIYPWAFAGDCTELMRDLPVIECAGTCDGCNACWGLSKANMNVHFKIH